MAEAVLTEAAPGRRTSRNGALALASFGALLAFLDVTIVNVAFPDIQATFDDASYGDLSWVLNSYNIVFAAVLVAAGRLADVFGRRRTFSFGILVFTVASVLCAMAPGVDLLIAARVAQAVGAGLLVPASLALVVEAFPAERRSHAIGLWGATAAFASGIGPPLGGWLVELQSWRLAFLINLPLGIAALVATNRVLVESRAPGRRRMPDLRGAAMLGLAMACLTFGIVEGPTDGWGGTRVVLSMAAAVLLAAGFVLSSRRAPVPVLDPQLFRIRSFLVGNVVTFVAGMGFYAYMLNNILFLHYVWGYSLLRSGLAVAPGALVAVVVAGALGKVADRHGHRLVAVPGALVWAGAYLWYVFAVGDTPAFLGEWLPGQVLSGIGVGATLPIVASAALVAVPGGRYATASAVVSSTRQLGAVLGVALLVDIVGTPAPAEAADAFRGAYWLSIVCFLVAAAGATGLRREATVEIEDVAPPAAPDLQVRPPSAPEGEVEHSTLLGNLSAGARKRLLDDSELVTVPGGQLLFSAGDPTDAMYLVRAGRLEVLGDGGVLRELVAGDVVGELGVLTGSPRSAAVRARRDSLLWRITPERVDEVLRKDTRSLRALTTSLATQLQAHTSADDPQPMRRPRVVAVVGVGDRAPVHRVAERLRHELSRDLRVLLTGSISPEQLQAVEPQQDRVLLVADDPRSAWYGFALRQADRVVVVAESSTPAAPLAVPSCDGYLVLVGTTPSQAERTAWHDALSPRFSAVVTRNAMNDAVDGIGRRLAGRSIAVAVAGGGARSMSAIGIVEELHAAGFAVDRYSGCSVGSVVAALFASGRDAAGVDAVMYDEFVRRNPFNDYRLPSVSVAKGRKTEDAIRRHLGDITLEELPHELVLVSTDLLSRELVVHRRGSVGAAIRASLSLPGLFPPARIGDALHVDGGVLDNLPVRPLTDLDEGPVVAVNISAASPIRSRGRPPRMPTLGETLMRTMLMGGTSTLEVARAQAAVFVTPDTRGIGLLEFHQLDRAREAGRVAGRAVAAELLAQRAAAETALPLPRRSRERVIDVTDPAPVAVR